MPKLGKWARQLGSRGRWVASPPACGGVGGVQIARGRQPRAIRLRPNTTFWAPTRVGVGNLRAATGGSRNSRPANSPAGRSRAAVSRARSVYRPTFRMPATRRVGRPATRGRSSRATNFQAGRSRAADAMSKLGKWARQLGSRDRWVASPPACGGVGGVQIARGRQPRAIRLPPNTTFWAPTRAGVGNLRAATGGSRNSRPANSPAGRSRAAVSRARSVYRPTFRMPATRSVGRPATRGRSSRATNFQAGRSRAAVSRARFSRGEFFGGPIFWTWDRSLFSHSTNPPPITSTKLESRHPTG